MNTFWKKNIFFFFFSLAVNYFKLNRTNGAFVTFFENCNYYLFLVLEHALASAFQLENDTK